MSVMKPILFNTEMVRAILGKKKTVTRRVLKTKKYIATDAEFGYTAFTPEGHISCRGTFVDENGDKKYGESFIKLPYCKGDILYVRETWCRIGPVSGTPDYIYKADDPLGTDKWHPSIHMPKEAARIFLRVTDVRVERLRDIMEDPPGKNNQVVREGFTYGCDFIACWDNTIKKADIDKYGYYTNPWVWVIEFERISKEEK